MVFSSDGFENDAANAMQAVAMQLREVSPLHLGACLLPGIFPESRDSWLKNMADGLGGAQTAIYTVSLPDADPIAVHDALTRARDAKLDGRCYSRVLPLPANPSNILYVGSSRSLKKRLLEHLGFGAKKTYSLHLNQWAQGFGPVQIEARCYADDLAKDLLCALEDHMAAQMVPLFGKRGSV